MDRGVYSSPSPVTKFHKKVCVWQTPLGTANGKGEKQLTWRREVRSRIKMSVSTNHHRHWLTRTLYSTLLEEEKRTTACCVKCQRTQGQTQKNADVHIKIILKNIRIQS